MNEEQLAKEYGVCEFCGQPKTTWHTADVCRKFLAIKLRTSQKIIEVLESTNEKVKGLRLLGEREILVNSHPVHSRTQERILGAEMSLETCSKCGRRRPDYIADAACNEGGYCHWHTKDSQL